MKRWKFLILIACVLMLCLAAGTYTMWWKHYRVATLGTFAGGAQQIEVYVATGYDSALLGLGVRQDTGKTTYFPLYASVSADLGISHVKIVMSDEQQAIWVLPSWQGKPVIGYYRFGSKTCMTYWGELEGYDVRVPASCGGGVGEFPPVPDHVTTVLDAEVPKDSGSWW